MPVSTIAVSAAAIRTGLNGTGLRRAGRPAPEAESAPLSIASHETSARSRRRPARRRRDRRRADPPLDVRDVVSLRQHDLEQVGLPFGGVVALQVLADEARLRPHDAVGPRIEVGAAVEHLDADRVFLQALLRAVERAGDHIFEEAGAIAGRAELAALEDARKVRQHFRAARHGLIVRGLIRVSVSVID